MKKGRKKKKSEEIKQIGILRKEKARKIEKWKDKIKNRKVKRINAEYCKEENKSDESVKKSAKDRIGKNKNLSSKKENGV